MSLAQPGDSSHDLPSDITPVSPPVPDQPTDEQASGDLPTMADLDALSAELDEIDANLAEQNKRP